MADPVWLLVMFDLPVVKPEQRRAANGYRKLLIDRGFTPVQLSVYGRYMINSTAAVPVLNFLKATVPREGYVRVLRLTDRQWAGGWNLYGSQWRDPEPPPDDLMLF